MKWGVVVFPGTNDDRDTVYALSDILGFDVELLWHADRDLRGCDAIVFPGGFSYGDYLRCGAIARFSPLVGAVVEHARGGGTVLGICNGFQILCEAGLLPGALLPNRGLRFICRLESLKVESVETAFSATLSPGELLQIPIKHGQGNYVADDVTLRSLEEEGRVVFRYADGAPNGSANDIAGIANPTGNVVGLMPHPEHAVDPALGKLDGRGLFESARLWLEQHSVHE
ncbi:MAG: phosphoribosylformylglycinamidine synthase subunit PurQ [Candidatus Binatia bacterium]